MKRLGNWLTKLDDNLVKLLVVGFIFLIPLYPKLPLKMINYTYIAVRLEDVYFAVLTIIFFIQLLRKKVELNSKFFILFAGFWLAAFISFFFGMYIQKTIPVELDKVGFLNALRRVEYMGIFFIAMSAIKSKKDFWHLITAFFISLILVVLYGFGQKFLNFPAVQTMNPEYAKGYLLYLTPEARISSTFAGHYDLGAYLVFCIPIVLAFYFQTKKKLFIVLFVAALTVLLYTSSRASFLAYTIAVSAFLLYLRKYRFLIFVFILTALLMFITGDLTKRFLKTFQVRQILVNEKTGEVFIGQIITAKELPAGSFYVKINNKKTITKNTKATKETAIIDKLNEATISAGRSLTKSEKDRLISTLTTNLKPVNTVVSDISFATRLQVEWPRALHAFLKNPLLGTGPSSITEATDNDFLRWLGEFGLLGTVSFLAILGSIVLFIYKKSQALVKNKRFMPFGLIFGLLALLVNASYIDVFEASKVAFNLWLIMGIFIGYLELNKSEL